MENEHTPDPGLDRALEAAFGGESTLAPPNGRGGVSIRSRIMLRDEGPDETPLVNPSTPERFARPGDDSRYQIVGEIARGGVGVVLKGRDAALGRDVAMKVLQGRHAANAAMVQRFVEEAQISGQLQHPGILPVYELGLQADQRPYFTMKLVKGRTLAALLEDRADPADDRPRFLGIFQHVCQTMAYAHTRGVVHRDLKPSNIMVGAFGEVQVVDWGLAKVLAQGGVADERHERDTVIETVRSVEPGSQSMAGSVMGTPAYISPEQARGDVGQVDERSDVFALGAILCEILTGGPPFSGPDALTDAAAGRLDAALGRLDACTADDELVQLARTCMAPARPARPRSARAVADAVTGYLAGVEERARESELAAIEARTRVREERRARRLTLALAATAIVAVVAIASVFVWNDRQAAMRLAQRTEQVNTAIEQTRFLLGQAETAHRSTALWAEARAAAANVERLAESGDVEPETFERIDTLLADLDGAERDRRMVERIEDLVVRGATQFDGESWKRMDDEFAVAFREYGIDADRMAPDAIAGRLRASEIAAELTNGFELWLGTRFNLLQFGIDRYDVKDLIRLIPVLYAADPDPFRTTVRQTFYGLAGMMGEDALAVWRGAEGLSDQQKAAQALGRRTVEQMTTAPDFRTAMPVTLSWLAITASMSGDLALADEIYGRAMTLYPDDFLLNFDYSFFLAAQERWAEAIGQYRACLALRPENAGIWRCLGNAYHGLANARAALQALRRSIEIDDHGPTHADLAAVLQANERFDEAIESYERAAALGVADLQDKIEACRRTPGRSRLV